VCSGAVVAFEMAWQLISAGRNVAFIGMVEPSPPRSRIVTDSLDFFKLLLRRAFGHAGRHSRNVVSLNREERRLYLKIRLRFYAIHLAVRRYRPRTYPHRLHLYLTDGSLRDRRHCMARWSEYSQQSPTVRRISGTHDSIVGNYGTPISEPGMQSLATHLKTDICRAE